MKKISLAVLFILFIPLLIFAKETIRITNGEWAPYLSKNLSHNGFASHVVKEAFSAVGINVEYGFFPWKRSYKLAKEGEWHGTVVWVYTKERAKYFHYSDAVIVDSEHLFHLKEFKLEWDKTDDLQGLKIGGTLHTVYPVFEKAEIQGVLTIERSGTYENLYRRLLKKRIDAIPQVSAVGSYLIRTKLSAIERSHITFSPTIIEKRKYSLILSKAVDDNKRYLKLFNEGLAIIKKNGKYNHLYSDLKQGRYDN